MLLIAIYNNKQPSEEIIESRGMNRGDNRISKKDTILKIKSFAKLRPDSHVTASISDNKSEDYKFNNRGEITMPLQSFLQYHNGS